MTHIHVSALDALIIGAYVTIWMFLMRLLALMNHENSFGRALAFIH